MFLFVNDAINAGYFVILNFYSNCFKICSIFYVFTFTFNISSNLVTLIKFNKPFCFLNCFHLITVHHHFKRFFNRHRLSVNFFWEYFKQVSLDSTSAFESSDHFQSQSFNTQWSKSQLQCIVYNRLKRFLDIFYIVFMTFRSYSI